ncbi:MAG: HAD family phosphatase [Candidatus Aenigmarchaeota archaeon]|nr:HAD family phosphatase [Candidatus Aenigmarchaeota archaeon]
MEVKGFLFDFDETVVYSNMDHVRSYIDAGKRFGLRITKRQILERFGKSAINILTEMFPEMTDEEIIKMRDLKEKIYRQIISKKDIQTIAGTEELLKFLRRNNVKCAIVSSASIKNIKIGLRENKLTRYFQAIVGVENSKRHKPNPDPVLKAAKMLGLKPKDCVMIGDSKYDVIAGKRAKAIPLGLTTGYYSEMQLKFNGAKACFRDNAEVLSRLSPSRHSVKLDI